MKLRYLFIIVLFWGFSSVWGNNKEVFEQANEAYKNEKYVEAQDLYLQIIENGQVSWALFYNLGNTFYRLNDMPKAILYYEKARKLNPSETDILENLKIAKNNIEDKSSTFSDSDILSFFNKIIYAAHSNTWAILSLVSLFAMAFLIIGTYLLNKVSIKRTFLLFALAFLAFSIIMYAFSQIQKSEFTKSEAIIMESSVTITSEPKENATNLFILHAGSKVEIIETNQDWVKIKYDNDKSGWMHSNQLEII